MKKAWVLSYPLGAQWRLRSDRADAPADLSLRWAHTHFVGFSHVLAHLLTFCFKSKSVGNNTWKVDKKAIIRNRNNRIPYPALNTKPERDSYNLDGTKIKTAQVKSQGDSSFPTDGHKAILNKKTNRKRTLTIRINRTKIKTAQVKSQGNCSFPTNGHKAILNKKTNRKRTLTIRINHNRSIALERSVINYLGLKPVLLCSNPRE